MGFMKEFFSASSFIMFQFMFLHFQDKLGIFLIRGQLSLLLVLFYLLGKKMFFRKFSMASVDLGMIDNAESPETAKSAYAASLPFTRRSCWKFRLSI